MYERTMTIVYFDCTNCPKKKAQSVKAEIARRGICRTCRIKLNKVAKGQIDMFEQEHTGSNTIGVSRPNTFRS
jgi:hypothetical protein